MLTRLRIDGMVSPRCVQGVFTALTPVEGIATTQVWIGGAEIEHDGRATVAKLREAISVAGYSVADASEERRHLPTL